MNYPGYVGEMVDDDNYHLGHPGLGYKYTSEQVTVLSTKAQGYYPYRFTSKYMHERI
jgi:hypothetical protein